MTELTYNSFERLKTIEYCQNDPKMLTIEEIRAMNTLEFTTTLKNKHEIGKQTKKTKSRKQICFVRRKIRKKPSIRKKYKETINQYILKSYARKLSQNETRNTSDITCFMPHHCVLNCKECEKVRAVFNAGTSLHQDRPDIK